MPKLSKRGDRSVEDFLLSYIETQGDVLSKVSVTIETIKEELHKTNTQIAEHLANNKIQLIEAKTEILNKVLEKFVEKEDYASDLLQVERRLQVLTESVDSKVDKGTVKLLWILVTSVSAVVVTWFFGK